MSLPPSEIPQGAIRFNTDSQKLEFYAQGEWWVMSTDTPNLGTGADSTPGARGVFGGGYAPGVTNTMEYINISSTGNAQNFGDLTRTNTGYVSQSSCSSSTRGLLAGGFPMTTSIDYWTFSSTGNAASFGSLTVGRYGIAAASNATRGVFMGGNTVGNATGINDTIDYVTLASTGNAVDFGNTVPANHNAASCSSPIRGFTGGGSVTPGTNTNSIDYITFATLGDTVDFSDLTRSDNLTIGLSNATRGVFAGGWTPNPTTNTIDYFIMTTQGNAVNFGDLTVARASGADAASPTRGVFIAGYTTGYSNIIDYINISTQGDAVDFGDTTTATQLCGGSSNAHGGL